ncbi:MAG: 3-oxoacyl-[acyl-carrier-protein] reductase [Planctomycetota bacterium]
MFPFEGKRVVVTGGSRGIGEAVVRHFAGRGAKVAIIARDPERARAASDAVDGDSRAWAADISVESSVKEVFASITGEWGGVDILVNNAGVTRDRLLLQMKADEWEVVMATNLRGTFLCSRAVIRPMLKQRSGRIINISSVIGLIGNAGQGNYAASKAGIIGFTRSLAREVATRSITVNAIAPGMIDTDMTRSLGEEAQKEILGRIPLGRLGTGDDIAAAALFLASDSAAYITGEVLRVDGGMAI